MRQNKGMKSRPSSPAKGSTLVWERPERASRPALEPLSRERIVRAAIAIADAEGLVAVSLRRIAAALTAGPMRLYGYVATKEELLELMVDAIFGEMLAAQPEGSDWREALRSFAHRTRKAAGDHPWFIELLGGRMHLGPNALSFLEASLAALNNAPGFADIDAVMAAVNAVNAYVLGAIRGEQSELRAEKESGMNKSQWQLASQPYIYRLLETGRFPTLAKVVKEATHPPREVVFERGLECLLDGIAARFAR